jgi:hypothetical protein
MMPASTKSPTFISVPKLFIFFLFKWISKSDT